MSARTRQTNNNAEALDDFISAKFEIDAMLERLKGFSEDRCGARSPVSPNPDAGVASGSR
ncbi:MAG: hypothetical protein A3D16_21575 [Rhodobacterales bacterium RIFCSPHIGHO2_02_FULL_62_130]|nr:MAG: hypothetical protein A3D16_21575 [Rhodobacterales bacterium RIFCSPHIGHO2_02_FULL_62_130]OHC59187.1 MAG: hypothetical protein A3E48_01385 [Rhodobacterales bacterium RIFCSPHIGHO2_12_FULL_62_75]